MTESELRELVKIVIAEVLSARGAMPKPRVLALFTGALVGFDDAAAACERLAGRAEIDVIQTESAKRILDQARIGKIGGEPGPGGLVGAHDILVIPSLTVNIAAKLAHGVSDCLASNVTSDFILAGKPVVAAVDAACPDNAEKRRWFPQMPAGYAEMMRRNLATLKSFGVRLTPAARLDEAVLGSDRESELVLDERVITATSIAAIPEGATVLLGRRAIVTDLAKEAAKAAKITLVTRN